MLKNECGLFKECELNEIVGVFPASMEHPVLDYDTTVDYLKKASRGACVGSYRFENRVRTDYVYEDNLIMVVKENGNMHTVEVWKRGKHND